MREGFVRLSVRYNGQFAFSTSVVTQAPPRPVDFTAIVGNDFRWNVFVDVDGVPPHHREEARRSAQVKGARLILGLSTD